MIPYSPTHMIRETCFEIESQSGNQCTQYLFDVHAKREDRAVVMVCTQYFTRMTLFLTHSLTINKRINKQVGHAPLVTRSKCHFLVAVGQQ